MRSQWAKLAVAVVVVGAVLGVWVWMVLGFGMEAARLVGGWVT